GIRHRHALAAQNLNLPKLRDDLVGLVSLVCHCGPPSWSKPYFKVDPFNGGGSLLRTPEVVARAVEAARRNDPDIDERDVVVALSGFDGLWESLFPAEQARIARLLIERVTVSSDGLAVDLRTEGLGSVIREMVTPKQEMAA